MLVPDVPNTKRLEYWNHFIARWILDDFRGIANVTAKKLSKVRLDVLADDDMWEDIIVGYGGLHKTPEELMASDAETYMHCAGNFWGQVRHALEVRGLFRN